MAHFVPLTTYACAGPCSAWSSLMSLRRPSLQKERPPHPSLMTDGGNRETGLGFTSNVEDKREGSDPLWTCRMFGRKPPCRAMLALASRFRYACSATPIKRLIDQMNRFVPPSGIEPASTVLQTVALPFKLQRRRTTDCYGIWVIGPSLVRRTVCFPSLVSRAAGRRSCRSLSDNRLMRLCSAIYQASCPDGITISGPSA